MANSHHKIVVGYDEWRKLIGLRQNSWERIANINPICYSFNYFCPNHINFNIDKKEVKRWHLVTFIETVTNLSKETSETINELNHCHSINNEKIERFKLEPLARCSENGILYSFGNEGKPVRLIGFFDKDKSYLFHVCLIDWNHKLYSPQKKYVF